MHTKLFASALLCASLMLTTAACGRMLSQAASVEEAVESKSYDVDGVAVALSRKGKTVMVYLNQDFDEAQEAEIADTAQGVVPDAKQVNVLRTKETRPDEAGAKG